MFNKRKFIIFAMCISFSSVSANAGKCIRGYEPSDIELIEAENQNEQFNSKLQNLAILANKNPQNESYKIQFDKMTHIVTSKSKKIGVMISEVGQLSDLENCDEASLSTEDFKKLVKTWEDILGNFPINKDIVYNVKLLHDLAFLKAGF